MRGMYNRSACVLAVAFLIVSPLQVFADVNVNVSVNINSGPSPLPNSVGNDILSNLTANVTTPTPPEGCTLSQPTWAWNIVRGGVQYSADNTTWGASPGGDSEMVTAGIQYPQYATLDASFKTGGYWKVTCQTTVTYTDSCGTVYSGSATTTATMGPVIQVTVLRKPDGGASYQAITGNNANCLPGQYIDLQASVLPTGLAGVTYSWTIPGATFSSYSANNNTATLTQVSAASYSNQTIQFIWSDWVNGRTVTCRSTYTGQNGTVAASNGSATMNILAPTITYTAQQGATDINVAQTALGLFPTIPLVAGIGFSATVQVPDPFAAGSWQFVQTVTPARTRTVDGQVRAIASRSRVGPMSCIAELQLFLLKLSNATHCGKRS